jgi:hypothetical protein
VLEAPCPIGAAGEDAGPERPLLAAAAALAPDLLGAAPPPERPL